MEFQLLESEVTDTKLFDRIKEIQALCSASLLFEQCIANLAALPVNLAVISFRAEGKRIVAIGIHAGRDKEGEQLGHIFLDAGELRKRYNVRLIPPPTRSDSKRARPKWYDARDTRLRIKHAEYHEVAFAAPAALPELILSYALQDQGLVRIRKEIQEGDDYVPHFCIRLQLNYHFEESELLQQETIHVRCDRLQRLIDKRIARLELEFSDVVVN